MTPDDGLTMFWWTFACACAMASDGTVAGRATPRRARRAFRALLARGKIEDGGGGERGDGDDEDGPCMRAFSRARVPHRWFQHFYVVGCAANAATLARPGGAGRRRGVGVGVDGGGVGIVSGAPVSTIIRERVGVELSARGDDARGGVRARVGVLSVRVSHVGGRRFAGGGGGVPLGGRGARFDIGARDGARRVRRCRCARVRRG